MVDDGAQHLCGEESIEATGVSHRSVILGCWAPSMGENHRMCSCFEIAFG